LWHGANWTFVAWGLLHGFFLSIEVMLADPLRKLSKALPPFLSKTIGIGITFSIVCVAYVFFRAESLAKAGQILAGMPHGFSETFARIAEREFVRLTFCPLESGTQMLAALFGLALLAWVEELNDKFRMLRRFQAAPSYYRWAAYTAMLIILMNVGAAHEIQFIYFQF
jgi:hypothetical protein